MKHVIPALAITCAFAAPAFAQDHAMASDMTCADFTAMDSEGQMKAAHELEMASSEGAMASESEDEMASDNMESDSMASEGSSDSMESGDMASEGSGSMESDEMASDEPSMASEETVAGIADACDGHPDMMAMDAMQSAM